MKKIYIGKIVSTHGIKGEVKIISDFPYKDKVFKQNQVFLIDDKEYQVDHYRHHKIYDMVLFHGYNDINGVLFLLKKKVYIDEENLHLTDDEILDEELVTFAAVFDFGIGQITEVIQASPNNKVLRITVGQKEVLVPIKSPMVTKIDKTEKKIYIQLIDGMIE